MKIYLAGPDVFLLNAYEEMCKLRERIISRGLIPLSPLDTISDNSHEIYHSNINMIKQCDAVFANLLPFRGTEPDSGTVFEVGFAIALDKLVFGYNIPECTYKESVVKILSLEENSDVDRNGHSIENFGHWGNLMLAYSVFNCGTLEGCCRELNYQMRIR